MDGDRLRPRRRREIEVVDDINLHSSKRGEKVGAGLMALTWQYVVISSSLSYTTMLHRDIKSIMFDGKQIESRKLGCMPFLPGRRNRWTESW